MYFFDSVNHISLFVDCISHVLKVHLLDLARCISRMMEAGVLAQMIYTCTPVLVSNCEHVLTGKLCVRMFFWQVQVLRVLGASEM